VDKRTLAEGTVRVSPVVFGAMAHDEASDEAQRAALMQAAIDAGITSIDTAPLYGFGASERSVGRAIRGRRDHVQVLGKVGLRWDDDHGDVLFVAGERVVRRDGRPEAVLRDVAQSLERLDTDYLDLVQLHHPDPHVPIDETLGALADLQRAGAVRAIGVSNVDAAQLERARSALAPLPLASTQQRYSLVYREVETELLPACLRSGVALLAYSPLAQGLLADAALSGGAAPASEGRHADPAWRAAHRRGLRAAAQAALVPVARAHGVGLAEVAIAWLLAQPGVGAAIVGASCEAQVVANAGAAALVLAPDEVADIRSAFETVRIDPAAGLSPRERAARLVRRARSKARRVLRRLGVPPRRR